MSRSIEEWDVEIARLKAALSVAKRALHSLVRSAGLRARHKDPEFAAKLSAAVRLPWSEERRASARAPANKKPDLSRDLYLDMRRMQRKGVPAGVAREIVSRDAPKLASTRIFCGRRWLGGNETCCMRQSSASPWGEGFRLVSRRGCGS